MARRRGCCQAAGETTTYDDLIVYSGFAFRVQFHKECCPSAGHPGPGYTCLENGARALPWKYKIYESNDAPWAPAKKDDEAMKRQAAAAIKASIDRGIPVQYGSEEDGLIIGYADEGRRWWCVHPYHKWGKENFWYDQGTGMAGGKKWPWGIVVFTELKPESDRVGKRDLTVAALKQAVDMWQTKQRHDYFVGDAAYERWLQWLGDVEAGKVSDPKTGMQGNGWCYDVLVHSRRIAAKWLKANAADYPAAAGGQLLVAAGHYQRLADGCMKDINCPWDLAMGADRAKDWTSAQRQEQIRRLKAAREHDRKAIEAIQKALAALESQKV